MIRRDEGDVGGVVNRRARFGHELAVHGHLTGDDQGAGAFPRRGQLSIEQ